MDIFLRDISMTTPGQHDPQRGVRRPRDAQDADVVAPAVRDGTNLVGQQGAGCLTGGLVMVG